MKTEHDIFIENRIAELGKQGYVKSASFADFFNEKLRHLVAAHPKAKFVTRVGKGSIDQVVYLPKAKRAILSELRRQLAEYERDSRNTQAAIDKMMDDVSP